MESYLKAAHHHVPGKLIYLALQGSRLFGTYRPDSDYDLRGVFLPPLIDLIDSRQKDALSFVEGESEITLWSFPFWLRLLANGDTNAIDLYFAYTHPQGVLFETSEMTKFRELCVPRELMARDLKGMRGFVKSQAVKYGTKGHHYHIGKVVLQAAREFDLKNPKAKVGQFWQDFLGSLQGRELLRDFSSEVLLIKNPDHKDALKVLDKAFNLEAPLSMLLNSLGPIVAAYGKRSQAAGIQGADWKALSHSLRVLDEIIELHQTGQLMFPLTQAELCKQVKQGQILFEEVMQLLNKREQDAEQAELTSVLVGSYSRSDLDKVLLQVYNLEGRCCINSHEHGNGNLGS